MCLRQTLTIALIQADNPITVAEEAEVKWFYEDLQDVVEIVLNKMSFSS